MEENKKETVRKRRTTLSKETVSGKETASDKETVSGKETVLTCYDMQQARKRKTTKKTPAKKKCKPRGGNSPMIGMNGYNLNAGDNARFLGVNLALLNMPAIDMKDPVQVQQRLSEYIQLYLEADMKPTVAGMAISLNGMSRQQLWAIVHDAPAGGTGHKAAVAPEVSDCIKKTYFLLENLWETYMNTGKINPVAGIFLGKNNYNYRDQTEHVVTPNLNSDSEYSAEEIRERYIGNTEQKRLSDEETE